ncbi:carboxypeptidase-like regulatory domain-containing protein [Rhodanobacter sp. DHG33]|uniref:carboxypeptidase-like regulatory domain-containing protein n=1 Tax=Rhodanobacter sp. DHG33 TaxID=2775921 RepID=UPI00177D3F32|nr:carboxypeptidase-like regulatory domain-containing protein [Rhodanobacter sp. DHG33]MBD8897989.1 carboxypeptidase regulatory-like domain-containing protein [Rhodanobacter sp. DHG33]
MKPFSILLLVAAVAALAGCSQIKHTDPVAPQITGTVTRAGVPVAGAHVQLVEAFDDAGTPLPDAEKDEALTDAQGHFTVGPLYRKAKRVDLHTVPWGLRISADNKTWHAGWLSDSALLGVVPKAPVSAMCDLAVDSKTSAIAGDLQAMGKGPCILQLIEKTKR